MFKLFLLASLTIVSVVFAEPEDYPDFDFFHANCAMNATYHATLCHTLYNKLYKKIRNTTPDFTTLRERDEHWDFEDFETNKWLWLTRTAGTKDVTSDIMFTFTQQENDCVV